MESKHDQMSNVSHFVRWFVPLAALLGSPAMMIYCYASFAPFVAKNSQVHNFAVDYVGGIALSAMILVAIAFFPIPAAHRRVLMWLWGIRIGASLGAVMAFETFYGGGDSFAYYVNGSFLNEPMKAFNFGRGTQNMFALAGVFHSMVGGFTATKVIFAFLGLLAVYLFYRAAVIALGYDKITLLYILGIFPSLLFWSSMLGKEPVVLLGIAIYCLGAMRIIVQKRIDGIVWIAAGIFVASAMRPWLAPIFLGPFVFTLVMGGGFRIEVKLAFLMLAIPSFLYSLSVFLERFRIETANDLVDRTSFLAQSWARGGSVQRIEGFDSIWSMLQFAPIGGFTALFRPLPFEVSNPAGMLAGMENGVLLILFLLGLWRRGFVWLRQPVLLWAIMTLGAWAIVYGYVSYQNLGSAFRFRVQATPILVMLTLYLSFAHHLKARGDVDEGVNDQSFAVEGRTPRIQLNRPNVDETG